MPKPRLLDLFCKAGGAGYGYHLAGFEVVGVDHEPQKNCPFEIVVADAIDYGHEHAHEFDAIHASPPCQRYSVATKSIKGLSQKHPDLIPATRWMLRNSCKPYVIENVVGAPLIDPITLCGSMFDLMVKRHRLFEVNFDVGELPACQHTKFSGEYPCGRSNQSTRAGERSTVVHVYGHGGSRGERELWSRAMGIDWMTMLEMAQAIPPAYTRWIGKRLIQHIKRKPDGD